MTPALISNFVVFLVWIHFHNLKTRSMPVPHTWCWLVSTLRRIDTANERTITSTWNPWVTSKALNVVTCKDWKMVSNWRNSDIIVDASPFCRRKNKKERFYQENNSRVVPRWREGGTLHVQCRSNGRRHGWECADGLCLWYAHYMVACACAASVVGFIPTNFSRANHSLRVLQTSLRCDNHSCRNTCRV